MQNFNIGALSDWSGAQPGVLHDFQVMDGAPRRIQFECICEGETAVLASTPTRSMLVGLGTGFLTVAFVTNEPTSITFLCHEDARVWMRSHHQSQVIPESDEAPFTTIEPRTGPSDEMKRMMELVRLNDLRNRRALEEARNRQEELMARLEGRDNARTAAERAAPSDEAQAGAQEVVDHERD